MSTIGGHFSKARIVGLLVVVLLMALAAAEVALAQTTERVNVYQYAIDHPVADVALPARPSLGASVPQSVQLVTADDERIYGYFYFDGRPVVVEMATRAVVRIDE